MRKKIGSNIYHDSINGIEILYSYDTPVACRIGSIEYRTVKIFNSSTTRHINKWLCNTETVEFKSQEYFNSIVRGEV